MDGLKHDNLRALARKTVIETAAPGQFLFRKGETEKRSVYVLSGEVELREDDKVLGTVEGGTARARMPLTPSLPRPVSARARSEVEYISVDADLMDVMLTWKILNLPESN